MKLPHGFEKTTIFLALAKPNPCDNKKRTTKNDRKKRKIISIVSLCLGIVLVIAGIFRGEAETVLNKATRICMECIGIG